MSEKFIKNVRLEHWPYDRETVWTMITAEECKIIE